MCRTVRANAMKGQVISMISSSVMFLIDCLRCGRGHSIPQLYMRHTAGLLIQLFPQGSPRSYLSCDKMLGIELLNECMNTTQKGLSVLRLPLCP